ncbi:MAG: hypothetical protein R2731_12275 [Nocardioides sp.]
MLLRLGQAVAAGLVVAVATVAVPLPAQATRFYPSGGGDVIADEPRGQVFVSDGWGGTTVDVYDLDGNLTETITGLGGPGQMVADDDHTTLWIAQYRDDSVLAIDMATHAVTRVPLGEYTCPSSVAYTSGLAWVSYGCGSPGDVGHLATIDPATYAVTEVTLPVPETSSARLATTPAAPDTLAFSGRGSASALTLYDTTGGPTPTVTTRATTPGRAIVMTFTADGTGLLVAGNSQLGYDPIVLSAADLSPGQHIPDSDTTFAAAVRADGLVAIANNGVTPHEDVTFSDVTDGVVYGRYPSPTPTTPTSGSTLSTSAPPTCTWASPRRSVGRCVCRWCIRRGGPRCRSRHPRPSCATATRCTSRRRWRPPRPAVA